MSVTVSSSTSLTLSSADTYVFNGSSAATWTLPAVSGNTAQQFLLKNRGTVPVTLQRAGSDKLYTTAEINSLILLPGDACHVQNDGTYWILLTTLPTFTNNSFDI